MKLTTHGYGGRKISKKAVLSTNDPKRPYIPLTVEGNVEKFATITPARIILRGPAGYPIKGTVRIVAEKKYPFTLPELDHFKGKNITYSLEKIQKETGNEYLLTVINARAVKGNYHEVIVLPTTLEKHPKIKIWVYGELSDPLPGKKNAAP